MYMLEESLEKFAAPVYSRIQRSPTAYQTVLVYCSKRITGLVNEYHATKNEQQLLRELRNDIDYYIRRYHDFCIRQRNGMKAHYYEINANDDCDFEHLIPAARIRDLLLANIFTVEQALNSPTVSLSRSKHAALKDAGWGSKTPDMWLPFKRYSQIFDANYQTYDGIVVDPNTWTLECHFDYFKHLTSL